MRIGISTSVVQRGKTGIAQYLFGLLHGIVHQPHQHEFVLFVLEQDIPLFHEFATHVQIVPVSERFRSPIQNIGWHQLHLPALTRHLSLDLLHVPSYRRLLWRRPVPLVATIHDLAPFRLASKYDPLRMFYGRVIAKRLARRQHQIIAVSHNTRREIERCFAIPPDRITVIHNGIDHDRFHPGDVRAAQANAARRYGLDTPFFLYVARLEHPAKNHVRLIHAFSRFKAASGSTWKLALAGSNWHGAERIHQVIRTSPAAAEIRWLGFVPPEELPELYRAAGAFVYPSLYEGFGLPPVEAMACGCPVLSSTRGALEEVIGSAALVLDPVDLQQMTCQLQRIATEPGLQAQLRRLGPKHASRFDWRLSAAHTIQVYERTHAAGATLSR